VAVADARSLGQGAQPVEPVVADGLQQAEPGFRAVLVDVHERLGNQAGQQLQGQLRFEVVGLHVVELAGHGGADPLDRLQGRRTGEDRHPPKQRLLLRSQ
jgi:hypothetical protein